jgi:hypothetical protein
MATNQTRPITNRRTRVTTRPRAIQTEREALPVTVIEPRVRRRALTILAAVLAVLPVAYALAGSNDLRANPVTGVDYVPAVEYVAERHEPGQVVLTALTAPVYLALGSADDIVFLSSPLDRKRAQRYTRLTADGVFVDYWTGAPSVVDVRGLCNTLLSTPDLWLVVDESRLDADWAFQGPMATVIEGMTYVRLQVEGGAQVRKLAPIPSRNPVAERICADAMLLPPA